MGFWRQIKQSQIRTLSNQLKRSYFQIHSPCSPNYSASTPKIFGSSCQKNLAVHKSHIEFSSNNVRFFAAPVLPKTKKEEKDSSGPRLNEKITADVVRLVTEKGHFVVSRMEALRLARDSKLDLVEVQRNSKPPVCKLMDYHREKYEQDLKEKDRTKSKSDATLRKGQCKEIRFAGAITQKDLQIKADTAKRLMDRGYRVKCVALGGNKRKRTAEGEDSGTVLSRFFPLIEDIAIVESDTRVEDKNEAYLMVRHIKYGLPKKGSAKTVSRVNTSASDAAQEVESDNDVLYEELMDEDPEEGIGKSGWNNFDANENFNLLFDLKENMDGAVKNLSNKKLSFAPESLRSPPSISSNSAIPESVLDSGSRHKASSTSSVGVGNRYMKDPKNRSQRRNPMDVSSPDVRNTSQLGSQSSDIGRRPQLNMNYSPQHRETKHADSGSSSFKNLKFPEQEVSFSSVPSSPAEANRYKQRNPSDFPRQRTIR